MCVIIHALRKKNLSRTDVVQAMKRNNDGFFMCHWPLNSKDKSDRVYTRTLSETQALNFFDNTPDDHTFVMHARIPSKGSVTLDNVHGWEENGVMFCHNMTISSISGLMEVDKWKGTDSEYFFRKLFMPMHKGEHLADPNLKPGEMGPATKRLTSLLCGDSNKFLFIMPDNSVIRAGKWSTISTEKRALEEEREYDEVVSETIDADGKVTKKTQKIKKKIMVEREFATAVASNTYFRTLPTDTYNTGYGGYHGYHGYHQSTFGGYGTDGSDYDDYDYDYTGYSGYGTFKPNDKDKKDDKDKKYKEGSSKLKKSDIESADVDKFREWRKSLPEEVGKVEVIDDDYPKTTFLFDDVLVTSDNCLDIDTIKYAFNIALRALAYVNMQNRCGAILENSELVVDTDQLGFASDFRSDLTGYVVPTMFSEELMAFVYNTLMKIHDHIRIDMQKLNLTLPSEAVSLAMRDIIDEVESGSSLSYETADIDQDKLADKFKAQITALDSMLNLSTDSEVKANKDIEKYIRAAIVVGRKLKWIPAPFLLAPCDTMVKDDGSWVKSKDQEIFLGVLNFLAEACVTDGASLEAADKKFVAELSNLGFDFDKKGSMEIFTGSDSADGSDTADSDNSGNDSGNKSDDGKSEESSGSGSEGGSEPDKDKVSAGSNTEGKK